MNKLLFFSILTCLSLTSFKSVEPNIPDVITRTITITPANGTYSIPNIGNVTVRILFSCNKKVSSWSFFALGEYTVLNQTLKTITIDVNSYAAAQTQGVTGSFTAAGEAEANDPDFPRQIPFSFTGIPVP